MKPVLRILDHGLIAVIINGLPRGQESILKGIFSRQEDHAGASASRGELVLSGPPAHIKHILSQLPEITEGLPKKIETLLDNYLRKDYKITCKGSTLDLGARTHIMGIVNITPDSFSDGGRFDDEKKAAAHAKKLAAEGADIIDIGGESTRPGAEPLSEEQECSRVIPVITRLAREIQTPISIDTYKPSVAEKALRAGASLVNDISGLRSSPDMARVVADHGAAIVIMHMQGTPRNMQKRPVYADVVSEIRTYLEESIEIALHAGIDREQILIDPGIGFGKTLEHNMIIMKQLGEFRVIGRPLVLGTSRKKFIGTVLNAPDPDQRLEGTAATVALGIERGAVIVRVHDVAEMTRVARMTDAILTQCTDEQTSIAKQ